MTDTWVTWLIKLTSVCPCWHKFRRQSTGSDVTDDTGENPRQQRDDSQLDEVLWQHRKHAQLHVVHPGQNCSWYEHRKECCTHNLHIQYLDVLCIWNFPGFHSRLSFSRTTPNVTQNVTAMKSWPTVNGCVNYTLFNTVPSIWQAVMQNISGSQKHKQAKNKSIIQNYVLVTHSKPKLMSDMWSMQIIPAKTVSYITWLT